MISTQRLILRRWLESDAESLYKYASEPELSRLALWPTHTSVEMSRWVIDNVFIPNPDTYAIVLRSTQEVIGCIGLVPIGEEHYDIERNEREIGYWIGLPYWNQGLASEALNGLMKYLSNQDKADTLFITTDASNIASQRVAEKCGFARFDNFDFGGIPTYAYRRKLISESTIQPLSRVKS
ncbi:MAG: GNAT family N-acetyltransferase [Muribaculaceae bacterium]|nr:GNAT family N-acetyltransferase [Muribaculaceae bacterium]